jgi:hypothetical protein
MRADGILTIETRVHSVHAKTTAMSFSEWKRDTPIERVVGLILGPIVVVVSLASFIFAKEFSDVVQTRLVSLGLLCGGLAVIAPKSRFGRIMIRVQLLGMLALFHWAVFTGVPFYTGSAFGDRVVRIVNPIVLILIDLLLVGYLLGWVKVSPKDDVEPG